MTLFRELIQFIIGAICFFISYIFTLIIIINNIGDALEKINETAHEPLSAYLTIGTCLFSAIISTVITKSFLKNFKNN
jgi:hypothetical protein